MGRHSNIILTKEDYTILDSIKHISLDKSSVRPILPGKPYVYPPNQDKLNPLQTTFDAFQTALSTKDMPLFKALYTTYSGLSPLIAKELVAQAEITTDQFPEAMEAQKKLFSAFETRFKEVKQGAFSPTLYATVEGDPVDFYSFPLKTDRKSVV